VGFAGRAGSGCGPTDFCRARSGPPNPISDAGVLDESWSFAPDPQARPQSRRQVREALASWESGEFEWAALAVVSELTTNAVLHAKTEFTVRLALDAGLLRIEVSDLSPRRPQPREYSTDATTGRGLSMLSAIARSDGIEAVPGGKTVWCELMPGEARRTWLDDGTGRRHQRARPEAPDQPGRRCLAASVGAGGTSRRARSAGR
jgi:anti-sigma regulatory factor (Ser/Thr protein kinase)